MRRLRVYSATWVAVALSTAVWAPGMKAQSEPFVVYDTKPVILHGPYIVAPTETSAVIAWATDTPCHSKVVYGIDSLDLEATNPKDGMLSVGTIHSVRLDGLRPGQAYQNRVVSTRVVRLKAYWPDKGLSVESPTYSFRTFDRNQATASFNLVTDTHEDIDRINALMSLINWQETDFLVHTGDALSSVESEEQVYENWLDPITEALSHSKPLVYARGNHDTRGSYARSLFQYVPMEEGRYYYSRDEGPVHLLVLDTGEDKPDETNVYAHLNDFQSFRQQELVWLEQHSRENTRMAAAPLRVVVMHQPDWGSDSDNEKWIRWANDAKIDLVITGHKHKFSRTKPGESNNRYTILTVGMDQVASVKASQKELAVTVRGRDGTVIDSFTVPRRPLTSK